PPSFTHSAATFFRPSALLAVMTTFAPAAASVFAAMAPSAPVAPVTIAVLPLTLNSDSGSFRKSSDIELSTRSFRGAAKRRTRNPASNSEAVTGFRARAFGAPRNDKAIRRAHHAGGD